MSRLLLVAFAMLPVLNATAQATNEFVVISTHGQVSSWVLPADWQPRFEGEYLRFTERDRLRVESIAAIRPKRPAGFPGYHEMDLTFPTVSRKTLTHAFWIPDAFRLIKQVPQENGFYRIDRQTLVRVGSTISK